MGFRHFIARCIHRHVRRRIVRRLELDDAQQSRLDTLHETLHGLRDEARTGLSYQRKVLLDLLDRERIDRDEALRLARVPLAMVEDALPDAVDQLAGFCETLTEEQRRRLKDLIGRHTSHQHRPCHC